MLLSKRGYKDKKGKNRIEVTLKCDSCSKINKTSIDNYYSYVKRNGKDTTYCRSCSSKKNGLKNKGRLSPLKGKPNLNQRGDKSPCWNGGRYISSDGYVMVLNPNAYGQKGWKKYIKEHVLIIEQNIGRQLYKNEVVHHIDGDKKNNNITNLIVINNDVIHHKKTHHSLMLLGYLLYKKGIIIFDKTELIYKLKDNTNG